MSTDTNLEEEKELLRGLAGHNPVAIEKIYRDNFEVIQSYIIKNSGFADDARDIFQEAMVVLFEKSQSESFELSCRIRTFLYAVCRRLWLKRIQKEKRRYASGIDTQNESVSVGEEIEEHEEREEELDMLEESLNKIGEPCKSLLEAFYIQKKTMPEIAEFFGYTNADNAKTQKYKCLVRLKKLFFSQYKNKE